MRELNATLERLLTEAEDCDLIAKLASDPNKGKLFKRLATDLRAMVREVEAGIADRSSVVK